MNKEELFLPSVKFDCDCLRIVSRLLKNILGMTRYKTENTDYVKMKHSANHSFADFNLYVKCCVATTTLSN